MPSELSELAALITSSVSAIETACEAQGIEVPSLNSIFDPAHDRAFQSASVIVDAVKTVVAATHQLNAILQSPYATLCNVALSGFLTASLHAVLRVHAAEALHDTGRDGLPIDVLAKKIDQDPKKIGRLLRTLATNHIFEEVSPNVFAHNRISRVLDTNKPVEEILGQPELKHDNTSGITAYLEHLMDKSSTIALDGIPSVLQSPNLKFSDEPEDSAMKLVTSLTWYDWLESPTQKYRLHRFSIGMLGVQVLQPPSNILSGFDWSTLKTGDKVVDVGSGIGTVSMAIAKHVPHLKFILQDRPLVMEHAIPVWTSKLPQYIESGKVTMQPHDFFDAQPVKGAAVYLLQHILHNWSDPYVKKILRNLHAAASEKTRLVVIESIIAHACHDPPFGDSIEGGQASEAPKPLLPNYGAAAGVVYAEDILMMALLNSQERTLRHFNSLFKESGWKIIRVHRCDGALATFQDHHIEAIPIVV